MAFEDKDDVRSVAEVKRAARDAQIRIVRDESLTAPKVRIFVDRDVVADGRRQTIVKEVPRTKVVAQWTNLSTLVTWVLNNAE